MAILEHFSACILIDGRPCQEYAVDEDEDQSDESSEEYPEVTKYVEVVAGAQFAVRIQPLKSFDFGKGDCISVRYFSDGKCIVKRLQLKAQVKAKNILKITGKRVGDGSAICPFKFGNITFRDTETSDRAALLEGKYADLATISIEIWLAIIAQTPNGTYGIAEKCGDVIPEAAVKGGAASVQASLGDAERSKIETRCYKAEHIGKKPLAKFSFKCRTKEDLQKLSIIPRARSPTPLEDRPIESLNATEMRELLLRKKAAEELSRVKIKQEKKEANLREVAAIKRSREEAEDEDETIEVITIRKKKRTEPADIIELD